MIFQGTCFRSIFFVVSLIWSHYFQSCSHDLLNPDTNSLYINCGGKQAIADGKSYDGDSDLPGPARLHANPTGNWAYSTTGVFVESNQLGDIYSPKNITKLTMVDAELYTNARVSPISLTYYGFCLANRSYVVSLHFAEIMIPDDQTYGSLGRRVFDIYLQVHGLTILFQ